MSINQKMLESAIKYQEMGYNVIPVSKEKKALVKWEPFQKEKSTPNQIKEWFTKLREPNIGLITGDISDLFVIDTDTPESMQEIQNYLPENLMTPIQTTPHNGKHFFFKHLEGFSNRARVAPGIDIRTTGGYIIVDPSINGNEKGWHWLGGLSLLELQPVALPDAIYSYIKEFAFGFSKETTNLTDRLTTFDHNFFEYGRRDEDLFSVANAMAKQNHKDDFIYNVLERLIISWGENPDKKWIESKIKSAFSRIERQNRNLAEEVKQFILTTKGHIMTTDVHTCLHLTTRNEKKAVHMALARLVEDEIIERIGERHGCYRLIESNTEEIDFMGVEEKVLDLKFPFNLERWVKILPKNIIVVAGEKDAGKTAFLLNICEMNMGKFKINYFSSEMGAMELKARLNKFGDNLIHWKENINFRERMSNFADVIKPNDINIIDFLEITNEFYRIGGMITEIFKKLKKGVCIIALQKNPGTDFGLGGMRSIEKARMYLSISKGKLKIISGKNWASEINPCGMEFIFKLIQGSKFIETHRED